MAHAGYTSLSTDGSLLRVLLRFASCGILGPMQKAVLLGYAVKLTNASLAAATTTENHFNRWEKRQDVLKDAGQRTLLGVFISGKVFLLAHK
eukprot:507375-Amphidinium_carterae.1